MLRAVRCAWIPILVVALLAGSVSARERWRWSDDDWDTIRSMKQKVKSRDGTLWLKTRHWRINSHGDEQFTAELALFMERFWEVFSELISGREVVAVKPTVVVFDSKQAYQSEVELKGSRGYFSYRYSGTEFVEFHLYTYFEHGDADFGAFDIPILLHEGTHALLQKYLGPIQSPAWFTEGLAEYLEAWDLRRGDAENQLACRRHIADRLRSVDNNITPMPIQQLVALDQKTWNPDQGGPVARLHYAAAGAFVEMLLSTPENKPMLVKVVRRLSEGVSPDRVLGPKDIRQLEPLWNEHWRLLLGGS